MLVYCCFSDCSLCIRQYLDYKTQCPACFSETTSQQLRNNRLLDEILGLFPNLRYVQTFSVIACCFGHILKNIDSRQQNIFSNIWLWWDFTYLQMHTWNDKKVCTFITYENGVQWFWFTLPDSYCKQIFTGIRLPSCARPPREIALPAI